jgi:hypothetical protein
MGANRAEDALCPHGAADEASAFASLASRPLPHEGGRRLLAVHRRLLEAGIEVSGPDQATAAAAMFEETADFDDEDGQAELWGPADEEDADEDEQEEHRSHKKHHDEEEDDDEDDEDEADDEEDEEEREEEERHHGHHKEHHEHKEGGKKKGHGCHKHDKGPPHPPHPRPPLAEPVPWHELPKGAHAAADSL